MKKGQHLFCPFFRQPAFGVKLAGVYLSALSDYMLYIAISVPSSLKAAKTFFVNIYNYLQTWVMAGILFDKKTIMIEKRARNGSIR